MLSIRRGGPIDTYISISQPRHTRKPRRRSASHIKAFICESLPNAHPSMASTHFALCWTSLVLPGLRVRPIFAIGSPGKPPRSRIRIPRVPYPMSHPAHICKKAFILQFSLGYVSRKSIVSSRGVIHSGIALLVARSSLAPRCVCCLFATSSASCRCSLPA